MKFFTVLALLSVAALATAAPCGHEGGDHSNQEDNSSNVNKEVHQSIGTVGSNDGDDGGILSLLKGGILSSTTNNNYVNQDATVN